MGLSEVVGLKGIVSSCLLAVLAIRDVKVFIFFMVYFNFLSIVKHLW